MIYPRGHIFRSFCSAFLLLSHFFIPQGATNRMEAIDSALLRPGRFDEVIFVPPPDEEGRLEIFKVHASKMPISSQVDLAFLASIVRVT